MSYENIESQKLESPQKRKVSAFSIIILIAFLIILGIAAYYFFGDYSELGKCSTAGECGRYNIFYISGQGFVCANDEAAGKNNLKTKLLMFRYASKNAAAGEPAGCSCVESQCEVSG